MKNTYSFRPLKAGLVSNDNFSMVLSDIAKSSSFRPLKAGLVSNNTS